MKNTLLARKRIYTNDQYYKTFLLSDEEKVYTHIDSWKEQNNIRKADFIFKELNKYKIKPSIHEDYDKYQGIEKVEIILLREGNLEIVEERKLFSREGWEIFGVNLDRIIMLKIYTKKNRIIRFDFEGLIDNEDGFKAYYKKYIEDENEYTKSISEQKTKELINQIKKEQDCIIELSGSPLYENPKNQFKEDSKLVPKGNYFPFMLEFFSDLIIDEDDTYQGEYGLNTKYIKDAMKLIRKVEQRARELEEKYKEKGVKVTINGLNDGCEKGMAIYVWIPYQ